QEAERGQRVEEVARPARMQAEAPTEGLEALRPLGQLGEQLHLDGREQDLGGPEREAGLEDLRRVRGVVHGVLSYSSWVSSSKLRPRPRPVDAQGCKPSVQKSRLGPPTREAPRPTGP